MKKLKKYITSTSLVKITAEVLTQIISYITTQIIVKRLQYTILPSID